MSRVRVLVKRLLAAQVASLAVSAPSRRTTAPRPTARGSSAVRLGCRESQLYELACEFVFRVSYDSLLDEVRRTGACSELDLQELGRRVYLDLAGL